MKGNEIFNAIKAICDEKNLPLETVVSTVEAALAAAYRKDFAEPNQNIQVKFDVKSGASKVFDVKTVVPDVDLEAQDKAWEEQKTKREAGQEIAEEELIKRFNPKSEIMLSEAKKMKKGLEVGEEIITELSVPSDYGRMAAQTAKQVIIQRLREAERLTVFDNFKDRVGQIINAQVQRTIGRNVIFDIGQAQAVMPPEEQIRGESYSSGNRFRVYVTAVEMKAKGPEIIISRAHKNLVTELFAMEVPEISSGTVVVKEVAREPGSRTKLAVTSQDDNIDPVGSCVGQRGTRVQTVIAELGGEKIDIIEWSDDTETFIQRALSPAKIVSVGLKTDDKTAVVKVSGDQLSLAIGRGGQNVRLASKLTGWKIDIASEDGTVQGGDRQREGQAAEVKTEAVEQETTAETEADSPAAETKETEPAETKEPEEKTEA